MADPIDVYVGNAIRLRRRHLDQSQTTLANGLGITFQQVQKYERGANRVSASMLYKAAGLLGVSILSFFPGNAEEAEKIASANGYMEAVAAMPEMMRISELDPDERNAIRQLLGVFLARKSARRKAA